MISSLFFMGFLLKFLPNKKPFLVLFKMQYSSGTYHEHGKKYRDYLWPCSFFACHHHFWKFSVCTSTPSTKQPFTKSFRYQTWRYRTLFLAILEVGFPFHKPYPYSLYIGEDTSILGTGNVWWTIIQTVIETGKRDPPPTVRSILGASVSLEDGPPLRIGG